MIYTPIYTERLILREFEEEDWPGSYSYLSDPEVLQYMEFYPGNEAQAKDYVNTLLTIRREEPRTYIKLAVILKSSGTLIGECGLLKPHKSAENAELCCRFAREYWGRGYASEAAKKMLEFGFDTLCLHRISASFDIRNIAAVKLMESIGMKNEGCLREHKWVKDGFLTSLVYSILKPEFKDIRSETVLRAVI